MPSLISEFAAVSASECHVIETSRSMCSFLDPAGCQTTVLD
jgi:hypothetical protein